MSVRRSAVLFAALLAPAGLGAGASAPAQAAIVEKPVAYSVDGTAFEGVLVYDDAVATPRPPVLMVPNWFGVSAAAIAQAGEIAGRDYVVLVADVYGKTLRPTTAEQAGAAAGALRADRPRLRARANAALDALLAQAGGAPMATGKVAAIGFCFGGGTVLELARSGRPLDAVVSFHGNLDTPRPEDMTKAQVKGVLVLHGAADPFVPPAQVDGFLAEMKATKLDWQLVSFGNAVHSFTDPEANDPGKSQYDETTAKRAFALMRAFFDEKL
ncbi:dienelactone hydrolase family protein [Rhodospirillum rubrum]|uniref:Dienelactone hydrolase n=1 Tax=Rhodospirillum rubrum (strain ATCC 11170 / ATH 1.1.1 / DSM 467 / LMG 4362 / NCIMB 8255 / S1) TaxID=269796 RepID=Q2RQM3_RHORT|nr:dienelactone hydrolase family protein [Rhodospirillum rubrum]ABC23572.1 Dienelactone hydrolase [Rhodospirillum rubrum ATCC 11170]AEO49310.1 dienelactone hydrolase [Rhodospirillum rubrum F11]MBK5955247.1 dienelactone hydrolase [Rhodospirillum rubrum]QXG79537.1 dienelactone hydrolase family protein [Rhodospirillum rubrum]HCF17576.1 dienelactone hydrolase [Rhodospirillum rubrum]